MKTDTPGAMPEPPHPLATALGATLTALPHPRVLLLGIGSGRNLRPLLDAGASVDVVEADPERARDAAIRFAAEPRVRITRARYTGPFAFTGGFAAALSTHALLHGSARGVADAVAAAANRLERGAPFYATLGSTRDPRFAAGTRIDDFVSAPIGGSEDGVPHVFYDEARARTLFAAFEIDALTEDSAGETAGRWAHGADEAAAMVHWTVRARKR